MTADDSLDLLRALSTNPAGQWGRHLSGSEHAITQASKTLTRRLLTRKVVSSNGRHSDDGPGVPSFTGILLTAGLLD